MNIESFIKTSPDTVRASNSPRSNSRDTQATAFAWIVRRCYAPGSLSNPPNFTKFFLASLLACFLISGYYPQTSPGDETAEETLSRTSRNLHQWGTISSFHGLPSERVRAITQTSDGYLWFGTDNGLAKFDGRRVRTNIYSDLFSVPIRALEVSKDDTLWIGSQNGAYFVRDGEFKFVEATEGSNINSILIEKDAVFLSSDKGLIYRCTENEGRITAEVIMQDEVPVQTVARAEEKLVVGSQNRGLLEIKDKKGEPLITRPRPFFVNVLKRDPTGRLWLGARSSNESSGLFVTARLPGLRVLGENLGTVNAVAFDGLGNTWVGTDERGLFHFEGENFQKRYTFSNTSGSLRSDQILGIFVDREGVVWIGTDEGVNRFDPQSPRNEKVSENTQSNFVRVVSAASDGQLLAGTNRGLFRSSGEGTGWKNVVPDKTVYVIKEIGRGVWYIGTPKGLFLFDGDAGTATEILADRDIRAIASFRGRVYAADFGSGLLELRPGGIVRTILKEKVVSLHADGKERLWIGTTGGRLFSFDGKNVSAPTTLTEGLKAAIWSITGSLAKGLWLSTNKGLYYLEDKSIQPLLQDLNIRETVVFEDKAGKRRVWCAAEEGLFTLSFEQDLGWISSGSDIEQGFASQNMFSLAASTDRTLLIGTNRGIVRKEIGGTPPLIIADRILSQRLHQPRELETGIIVAYPQNTLSVEVTALSSRTFPEEFQYSFLLYDSDGKIITKRFTDKEEFLMEDLAPGSYRVEIRAFDRNLTASEPLAFTISVEDAPFPLVATILAVLLMIAIAALIWATVSQRQIFRTSNELAIANKELNSARLDLANEAERERHRIARDLHDQTLADLRHLLLMADDVPTDKANEFRTEIEGVSDEIRRICEDLSPSVLENIGFTAALEWELSNAVEQIVDERAIETVFKAEENLDDSLKLSRAEQIQVYRIAQEVLNNIVRHADPRKITLSVGKSEGGVLRLVVSDDGNGFVPGENTNKKGRGLTNIKARAQLIKAEIEWTQPESGGTEFTLLR